MDEKRDDSVKSRLKDLGSALKGDFLGESESSKQAHERIADRERDSLDRFYGRHTENR